MTTGTNQFLPFATGTGANVYVNSAYSGLSARTTGVVDGVADPQAANNAWRQGTAMASALGAFIAAMGYDALDDGDITTLEAHFEAALAVKIAGGQAVIPSASLVHVGSDTGAVNAIVANVTPDVSAWSDGQVYVIRPANTTTSTAPTFAPDGLTAKVICHPDGTALLAGEIVGGAKCILIYDSTLDRAVLVETKAYVDMQVAGSFATVAQILSNVSAKILTTDKVWGAGALTALTDAATIAIDLSTGINFSVTIAGNRTLANPSNPKVGQSGLIAVTQDSTGGRTLSFGSNYKFFDGLVPDLLTTAGAINLLYYVVISPTQIVVTYVRGVA